MGRFIGGRFGSIVPISPGGNAPSGVYTMPDQYYSKQDGGWVTLDGLTATGGQISDYLDGTDIYRAHVFTSSGTFVVSDTGNLGAALEYCVVGGGGGGGWTHAVYTGGGGGGAGGLRTNLSGHPLDGGPLVATNGTYTVTIGGGGQGGQTPSDKGVNGSNSEFYPTPVSYPSTAFIRGAGGGGGGNAAPPSPAVINQGAQGNAGGGSGGGTSAYYGPNVGGAVGPADSNHPEVAGYAGGNGPTGGGYACISGGGGGAGGAGATGRSPGPFTPIPNNTTVDGRGGIGVQVKIASSSTTDQIIGTPGPNSGGGYLAGGGGGGSYHGPGSGPLFTPSTMTAPLGGGGGSGFMGPESGWGYHATVSTGGGGGGGGTHNPGPGRSGGNGASGVVVLRYLIGSAATNTAKATGGAISFFNGKTFHYFSGSGIFKNTSGSNLAFDYVAVAGGGGGGKHSSSGYGPGGGGAGGVITNIPGIMPNVQNTSATCQPGDPAQLTIAIGSGGNGARLPIGGNNGSNGGNTTISGSGVNITATGGGRGGGYSPAGHVQGQPGGSGGAGDHGASGGGNATPNSDPDRQGYPQGSSGGAPAYDGWGGGGAGGQGGSSSGSAGCGNGGLGVTLPTSYQNPALLLQTGPSGPQHWFAGGGGGAGGNSGYSPSNAPLSIRGGRGGKGGTSSSVPEPGPFAGGGNGGERGTIATNHAIVDGKFSSGGGGGAAGCETADIGPGGLGGSGFVIISYPT